MNDSGILHRSRALVLGGRFDRPAVAKSSQRVGDDDEFVASSVNATDVVDAVEARLTMRLPVKASPQPQLFGARPHRRTGYLSQRAPMLTSFTSLLTRTTSFDWVDSEP